MKSLVNQVMEIEKRQKRSIDWFYYQLKNPEHFKFIYQNGIVSKKKIRQVVNFDYNDYDYYVRLYQFYGSRQINDYFTDLASFSPLLIVDHVTALRCQNKAYLKWLNNSFLPFRYSEYEDEYQAFGTISFEKIIGITCNLYNMALKDESLFLKNLKDLVEMITFMENESIDLPIYDHSRICGRVTHTVDKKSILYLRRNLN